jgi:TolB-like protein/class 3 adenylate cyclase/Tfp pilus assembly protein PilF
MSSVRRLTAILAADVAGYSRLMGQDEEGTHERLKAHLGELVNPKIAEHRGRIVKNTGDGFLAEFASVVDAVRCAVEIQRGMAERELGVPQDRRIEFRTGINLGDVIAEEHDIFGDGVNVAARLEALADPGGICVSRVVRDQVRDRLDYTFEDLGEQTVKNISRPVRVFALRPEAIAELPMTGVPIALLRRRRSIVAPITAAAAAVLVIVLIAWWVWPATRSSSTPPASVAAATRSISQPFVAPRLSIVVLPFVNLSNDPDQQYFADGITEDLTTDLSRLSHMLVISRNTAFTYKDKPVNAKQIGRDLGVHYVLEGSVQRSGNRVRVNAQLIDAESDAHLWAERFDRDLGDLFVLQNEITGRIANTLGVELIAAEAARRTEHPDALDYILRGRAARLKPNSSAVYSEATGQFERALALDPQSTEAQSFLAITLAQRAMSGMTDTARADVARAEGLARSASAASPRSWLAHWAKADVLRAQHRYEEAIPEYETLLSLSHNSAPALQGLADCKLWTGSIDEVIPIEEQAIRLSPRDPQIYLRYFRIGEVHLVQSRTDEAIRWLEKARSANPELQGVYAFLASAYALRGETDRAAAELAEARRLRGPGSYASIARLRAGLTGVQSIRDLFEATYFAGLRKAGVPEE